MSELLRDRYEPLEVVGQGGEGRVIRALDHQLDRQVALKMRSAPGGKASDELLREARVLLSLEPHRGLPLVRDDFFHQDQYIIVMDWIEGTDLDELLSEQGTPGLAPSTVLRYLAQVAEAITYLHTHDPYVVHGDVKPANMILTAGGRMVLVDFGLASSGDLTARAGTPGYVAPEVAAGGQPTRASDIYSFAVTAYTLLTGTTPEGRAPAWPRGIDANRKRIFERAVRLGTATDPARRPSSAGELMEHLRAGWEADIPVGVLTLCMTDIEDSTGLWETSPHGMGAAMVRHDAIVAQVVETRGGRLIQSMGEGDSTVSVFTSAIDAVLAASAIVGAIAAEPWPDRLPVRTRVGLHTGPVADGGRDRIDPTAARGARVRALAEGGQVFLSQATAQLVEGRLPEGFDLVDLGRHTLRGFSHPENVYALSAPSLRAPPSPAVCPYRGLLAFQPEDHDLFFGRDDVVKTLLDRLILDRFVAVIGPSGSGKSSLVRAGVIAAAQKGEIAGASTTALMTPGPDPVDGLRSSRASDLDLLVVDQFEEAFTLCSDESRRTEFFDELLVFPGLVLIALRADFYGHCAAHARLAQLVSRNNVLLGPMTEDEMRRAVASPAEAAELRLEPGLVELVLRDAAGEPGALPLISHALMESWARRDGRTLTLAGYREAGGVQGAIARTAEDLYGSCIEDERPLMRRVFLRLIEVGEGTEDTRRRVPLSELVAESESATAVEPLLGTLTRARLVTVDDDAVQLAHEALIREWPRLRSWLNEDREGLIVHRHLTRSTRAWEAMGRDPGELYRGARLAATLDWAGDRVDLTAAERAFLEASGGEQERELRDASRRARRLRAMLASVAVALVIAIVAGSVAVVQRASARRSATLAQSGRLAAQSREAVPNHPDLGLLLALEGHRLHDSVDSRGALLGALEEAARMVVDLHGFDSPVEDVRFAPAGKAFVTVGLEGARVWDTATHRPIGRPIGSRGGGWQSADFSPDGSTLAIAGGEGRVELWDVAGRRERGELVSPTGEQLEVVRFSPDGRVIVGGAVEDSHVTIWDARAGTVIGEPFSVKPPETGGTHWMAFSPDSRVVVFPGAAGAVGVWSVATHGQVGRPMVVGETTVEAGVFAAGGRELILGDDTGSVTAWDVDSRQPVGRPLSAGEAPVSALGLSLDGMHIAAGSFTGSIAVWEARTGTPFGRPLVADTSPVNDVTFSPDGRLLLSAHNRSAVLWDVTGRRQAIGQPLGTPNELAMDVSFSPDGRRLAVGGFDGQVEVFDVASRRRLARLDAGSTEPQLEFFPDGKRRETENVVTSVAFSRDGKLLAAGSLDGAVRFWDGANLAPAAPPIEVGNAWIWQIAFSPDGKLLAVATDPNGPRDLYNPDRPVAVLLFRVADRRRIGSPMVPGGMFGGLSVAFSPDGQLLATGSEGRAELWDVVSQRPIGQPLDVKEDGFPSVAFSPDGKLLAAGGGSGIIRLWNVQTRRPAVPPLTGHSGPATGAAFDYTARFLATTTMFGATRLWDPGSGLRYGEELVPGERPPSQQAFLGDFPFLPLRNAFSPDGRLLAVGGLETNAMLWDVDVGTWRVRACQIAGRNLTGEEWRTYLPLGTPYRSTCPQWPGGATG